MGADADWLQRNGWTVTREAGFVDVYAERGQEKLYAEVKGRTAAVGCCEVAAGGGMRRSGAPRRARRWRPTAGVVPLLAIQAGWRHGSSGSARPASRYHPER